MKTVRRLVCALALSLLLAGQAWSQPRDAAIETLPGGAAVSEVTHSGERVLGTTSSGFSGTLRVALDDATKHSLRVACPPYNEIHLSVQWSRTTGRWMVADCNVLPVGLSLTRLEFTRTVRFKLSPPPLKGWQVVVPPIQGETQEHEGQKITVVRMEQTSDGAFIVPRAYEQSTVYLEPPSGASLKVAFKEGELGRQRGGDYVATGLAWKTSRPWPVLAVIAAMAVAAAVLWTRRRRPGVSSSPPHAAETQAAFVDERPSLDSDQLPGLLGRDLVTDGGEAIRVLRRIGRGGMGAVFEAERAGAERVEDRTCAVKVLFAGTWDDGEFRERFKREVRICSALHHPNIVKIMDWGLYTRPDRPERVWPFMVMERVNGCEMSRFVQKDGGAVSTHRVLAWMIEALGALGAAHGAGVIHRDLKPANIMITERGRVKIMDFGVARQSSLGDLTRTDTAMGTPYYMSPEHLDAKSVTPASDIYSMGVILFELLSGRVPFEGGDMPQVLTKMLQGRYTSLAELRPDLPPALVTLVHRMFALQAESRYSCADAVIDDLLPILDTIPADEERRKTG